MIKIAFRFQFSDFVGRIAIAAISNRSLCSCVQHLKNECFLSNFYLILIISTEHCTAVCCKYLSRFIWKFRHILLLWGKSYSCRFECRHRTKLETQSSLWFRVVWWFMCLPLTFRDPCENLIHSLQVWHWQNLIFTYQTVMNDSCKQSVSKHCKLHQPFILGFSAIHSSYDLWLLRKYSQNNFVA